MFRSMIFTVVFFSRVYADVKRFSDFNIFGCAANISWSLRNASGYAINIKAKVDSTFPIQIVTESTVFSFTFVAERPGLNYTVTWTPIYERNGNRGRDETFREEHTFQIQRDCFVHWTTTPNRDKDLTLHLTTSHEPGNATTPSSATLSSATKTFFEPDDDFCFIYFWASVISFPLVLVGGLLLLYVWLIRRQQGTKAANVGDQGARGRVSVNSMCYANNSENRYYDESYYSLAGHE